MIFASREVSTAILDRNSLKAGVRLRGPAIVTEYSATTVVPPGASFHLDRAANLVIEVATRQKKRAPARRPRSESGELG